MSDMTDRIMAWMLVGEVGESSKAMAVKWWSAERTIGGYHALDRKAHPRDPADFRRCLLLLEVLPECRERMGELRDLSPMWNALVDRWDEIERTFLDEAPERWREPDCNWQAPRTYSLMHEVKAGVRV